jgi:integrating conjugative element protein (TIGR03759 family)
MINSLLLIAALSSAQTPSVTNPNVANPSATPTSASMIAKPDRNTLEQLGITETDWQRYQSVLNGPQANWSKDNDPLLVLGITARTAAERSRYAELYVEADRKRNAAILEFERAVQQVWRSKYGTEPLFTVPGQSSSASPLLRSTDRVLLIVDMKQPCALCAEVIDAVQRLGRANRTGPGVDIYFAGASFDEMVAFGRARGIQREDVAAKRITLNALTPEVMAQLQVTRAMLPRAFKRDANRISPVALSALRAL